MRHMRHSPVRGPAEYPPVRLVVVRELAEMDRDFALFMLELFHGPDHVFMVDYFCDMIQNADMVVRECEKALKPKTIGDTVTFRDDCEGSK